MELLTHADVFDPVTLTFDLQMNRDLGVAT